MAPLPRVHRLPEEAVDEGGPPERGGRDLGRRQSQCDGGREPSRVAEQQRVFGQQSRALLRTRDEISDSQRRITSPVRQADPIEPGQRLPDGVVALVRMAVLIVEGRDLLRAHPVQRLRAIEAVRDPEPFFDIVPREPRHTVLLQVVTPVIPPVVQEDADEAAPAADPHHLP